MTLQRISFVILSGSEAPMHFLFSRAVARVICFGHDDGKAREPAKK
jgi:hypothetical protein